MKLAITAAIYVTNGEHKKYLDQTTKSIASANHRIVWLPCENYVNPAMAPLNYVFSQQPEEVKIMHPTGPQSVAQAWNKGIEAGSSMGCDYILVLNNRYCPEKQRYRPPRRFCPEPQRSGAVDYD